jgi:signal transduction histidine kinase
MITRAQVFPFSRVSIASNRSTENLRHSVLSLNPVLHTSLVAVLVAVSYYLGSQVGFLFTPSETPIGTFWPPNAILLAAFLLAPPRMWWVLLLAVFPAHLLIQLRIGIPLLSSLGWFVGNTGEALIGAACIRYFSKGKPLFDSVRSVTIFLVFGVGLATLLTSFVDAASTVLTGLGRNYWMLWTTRFTSDVIADITIVPTVVIFGTKGVSWIRKANWAQWIELGLLALTVVFATVVAFGRQNASSIPALTYAPLLLLIWSAVRFGIGGLSASMLVMASVSIWDAMHARVLVTGSMTEDILALHTLLALFALPLLLMAALIAERRRAEESSRAIRNDLIRVQEEDRHRIARELRDDIIQQITLVGLNIDELREQSEPLSKSRFDPLRGQLTGVYEATSELSHELYPFALEYLGLSPALRKLCRETGAQYDITITLKEESTPAGLPLEVSRRLYSVVQEALRHIVQYSHAKAAAVELRGVGQQIFLRIADDGIGINPETHEAAGLTRMREQLLSLGGTFAIVSVPSKGTTIEASAPIKRLA